MAILINGMKVFDSDWDESKHSRRDDGKFGTGGGGGSDSDGKESEDGPKKSRHEKAKERHDKAVEERDKLAKELDSREEREKDHCHSKIKECSEEISSDKERLSKSISDMKREHKTSEKEVDKLSGKVDEITSTSPEIDSKVSKYHDALDQAHSLDQKRAEERDYLKELNTTLREGLNPTDGYSLPLTETREKSLRDEISKREAKVQDLKSSADKLRAEAPKHLVGIDAGDVSIIKQHKDAELRASVLEDRIESFKEQLSTESKKLKLLPKISKLIDDDKIEKAASLAENHGIDIDFSLPDTNPEADFKKQRKLKRLERAVRVHKRDVERTSKQK